MDKLARDNCTVFTEKLASTAPTPGGGGAAALAGALGVSLCTMAAGLTRGRKLYAERVPALDAVITRAEALRQRLLALIDEDAAAFAPLQRAYSLDKTAPDRAAILREASLTACTAPAEMLRCCAEAAGLLEEMLELSSPLLLSDVGCGAALCRGAMEAAALNVFVNTKTLKGDGEAEALNELCRTTLERETPRLERVLARVREKLEG